MTSIANPKAKRKPDFPPYLSKPYVKRAKTRRRRLPPYARHLAERIRTGRPPDIVRVFTGPYAWSRAMELLSSPGVSPLVLPPGEPASRYDWRLVRGYITIVVPTSCEPITWLIRVGAELLRAGADCCGIDLGDTVLPVRPAGGAA